MHMKKLGREEQTSRCVLSLRPQVPTLRVGQGFRETHVLWWVCLRVWMVTIPSGLWPGSCGILRAACPPLGEGGLAQSPEAGFCGLGLTRSVTAPHGDAAYPRPAGVLRAVL